jgi:hypothetical protein
MAGCAASSRDAMPGVASIWSVLAKRRDLSNTEPMRFSVVIIR